VNFIRFCVERRVTVAMLTVTVMIFGVISWFRLDREFMPELQFPQLTVLTSYPNASSQEVENLVTKVIEESAGTVKNVERIHSSSREGISVVTVEFLWGTSMDLASLNLREKVDLAKAKLPRDAGEPRIEKFNPFALPVITLSLSGPLEDHELLLLARRPVGEILEKTRGVAAVSIAGGREREILVELDQSQLASRGLPILDIGQAISRANITYPAGSVKDDTYDYVVRVLGSFDNPESLGNTAVLVDRNRLSSGLSPAEIKRNKQRGPSSTQAPQTVPLSAVAHVKDTFADPTSYSRYDGRPTVSLSILKQAEGNVVRTADEVKKKLPDIRAKLPKGVSLDVVYDQSLFITSGIHGMIRDGLVGAVLAFFVLLIFLGRWWDAVVVSVAIPVSLLATFFLLDASGLTINTVTLAGLAIGIGMLVDGAIVVQENIARERGLGKDWTEAAVIGTSGVVGPVTGSILTTVAVFLPLVFVSGVVGQVFQGLSWSVVFSQTVSLVVAFTVVPMLAGVAPRWGERPIRWVAPMVRWFQPAGKAYDRLLTRVLARPGQALGVTLVVFVVSVGVLFLMPRSLFPHVDGSELQLRLDLPAGTPLERTDAVCRRVESVLKQKEILHLSSLVGSTPQEGLQPLGAHQARIVVALDPDRNRSTSDVTTDIVGAFNKLNIPDARLFVFEQGGTFSFLGGAGAAVTVEVKGSDLNRLEKTAEKIAERLTSVPGLLNVRAALSESSPELQLVVKRDALADFSLSVADMAEATLMGLKGKVVSKFREAGKEIDIRVRLRPEDRENPLAVESLLLQSPLDVSVPLGAVASFKKGRGPSEIIRYDQERTVLVTADLAGRSIGKAASDIEKELSVFNDQKDLSVRLAGESARMAESFNSLKLVLILSIVFVFMIMAGQFESLWQPFLILFTIPLALIGMAPALLIRGMELSAMAGMGVILLGGIVVNNGIVLIDFVNVSRAQGLPLKESLRAACHTRIRPILMTAVTAILGMLPLSLGLGEGADMQAPMAAVVVAGLFVSTLLTLVVLPALFLITEERLFNPVARRALWDKFRGKRGRP